MGTEVTDYTDRTLVESTLLGDDLAFAELVRRHRPNIWRTVRRKLFDHLECEDAMQEIFLRAFASLSRFDPERPFENWIMRIASNYCIDVLRRRRSFPAGQFSEFKEESARHAASEKPEYADWTSEDLARIATRLLNGLKSRNRNAFVLRELEGREYAQIAQALRISPLAARVRVSRARKELHGKMCKYLQPELRNAGHQGEKRIFPERLRPQPA